MSIGVKKKPKAIEFELSSEPNLIFQVIQNCRHFFINDISELAFIDLNILLREMLMNAMRHGNKFDINRKVRCVIRHLGLKRFQVIVEDQGDGFDYSLFKMKNPSPSEPFKARGFILINALSDRIEFNTRGNRITIYYRLSDK